MNVALVSKIGVIRTQALQERHSVLITGGLLLRGRQRAQASLTLLHFIHCASFAYISEISQVLQRQGLWQPRIKQVL